ncbi:MAG: protein kinase [Legionellaceae bacterium]|nr:protein kinase [Legionellaceae bacterium]
MQSYTDTEEATSERDSIDQLVNSEKLLDSAQQKVFCNDGSCVTDYQREVQVDVNIKSALNPTEASTLYSLGELSATNGLHLEAIRFFSQVIILEPKELRGYRGRYLSYNAIENFDAAKEDLKVINSKAIFKNISYRSLLVGDRKLGYGNFGRVVDGTWNNIPVAIKKIMNRTYQDAAFEAKLHKDLVHENIVSVYKAFRDSKLDIYLVMELMSSDLSEALTKDEQCQFLTLERRIFILKGVLLGLKYLHDEHDIMHLDIKPENIMLSEGCKAKISDFGLSQIVRDGMKKRKAGTKGYAAPEVYLRKCEKKSDYYSFGVLFYVTMVTSSRKFYRDALIIKNEIKRRQKDIPLNVLEKFSSIIMRYTNKDPILRLPLLAGVINLFSDIEFALPPRAVASRNQAVKMEGFGLKLFSGPVNMWSREDDDKRVIRGTDNLLSRNL